MNRSARSQGWIPSLLLGAIVGTVALGSGPCCWFDRDNCFDSACNGPQDTLQAPHRFATLEPVISSLPPP